MHTGPAVGLQQQATPALHLVAPPMVRSWTGWNRLSVNCSSRQDLPTPAARERRWLAEVQEQVALLPFHRSPTAPVSPITMYLRSERTRREQEESGAVPRAWLTSA